MQPPGGRGGSRRRELRTHLDKGGDRVIEGQHLGPRGAVNGSDREDEWSQAFRASAVPDLLAALAGCDVQEILDLLQRRYASADSDKLEQLIGETQDIPDLLQQRYESTDSDDLDSIERMYMSQS